MNKKKLLGIITALDAELNPYLEQLSDVSIAERAMLKIYSGTLAFQPVIAVSCGIGRTNAALATQLLISEFHVTCILVSGTAGGMDPMLQIGDIVVPERISYHDLSDHILSDYHPYLQTVSFFPDASILSLCKTIAYENQLPSPVYFGHCITGDTFIEGDMREALLQKYHPLSVDMETAAISHVCYVNQIPFFCIRAISDTQKQDGIRTFQQNCALASQNAAALALLLIQKERFLPRIIKHFS